VNAEAAEVAILRAERAVDEIGFLDQFRRQALQAAQVALPVALRGLVLLDVIDEDLHAAVDTAVIEVKAEAADLNRLAPALVLACVDARIQLMKNLVVTGEERLFEDLFIAVIDGGFDGRRGDGDAGVHFGQVGFRLLPGDRRQR